MATIELAGTVYEGEAIEIRIDGMSIEGKLPDPLTLVITGDPAKITTDLAVSIQGNVYGDIEAGGHVSCADVDGDVEAAGSVTCGDVTGDVEAGNSVSCADVEGDVEAGRDVASTTIAGDVDAGRDVRCAHIAGNVQAGNRVSHDNITERDEQ